MSDVKLIALLNLLPITVRVHVIVQRLPIGAVISVLYPFWSHRVSISPSRSPPPSAASSRLPRSTPSDDPTRLPKQGMEPECSLAEMVQVYDMSTFELKPRKLGNEWFLFQNNGTRRR